MLTSILKLVYIHNERPHFSANHVVVFCEVKDKGEIH